MLANDANQEPGAVGHWARRRRGLLWAQLPLLLAGLLWLGVRGRDAGAQDEPPDQQRANEKHQADVEVANATGADPTKHEWASAVYYDDETGTYDHTAPRQCESTRSCTDTLKDLNRELRDQDFTVTDDIHSHSDPSENIPGPSPSPYDGGWPAATGIGLSTVVPDPSGQGHFEVWERDENGYDHYVIPGKNGVPIICDEGCTDTTSCDPPSERPDRDDADPCKQWPTTNECQDPQEC
jgi:hypothetical protein